MSTTTTPDGFPYPNPDEPVANMDLSIKALAQAVDRKAVLVQRSTTQSIPSGVATAVAFPTEESDVSGLNTPTLSGIVIPSAGLWLVSCVGGVAGTTGVKFVQILQNGAEVAAASAAAASGLNHRGTLTTIIKAAAADVVALALLQTSGTAQNTFGTQRLAVARLALIA